MISTGFLLRGILAGLWSGVWRASGGVLTVDADNFTHIVCCSREVVEVGGVWVESSRGPEVLEVEQGGAV